MFRSESAGVLRPKRPFVLVGTALLALVPTVAVVAIATGAWPILTAMIHGTLFGSMALNYAYRSSKGAKIDRGELAVDDRAVTLGGRVVAVRSELQGAFIVPTDEGTIVQLQRKGRLKPPVFVKVRDTLEAEALLRELGFDAAHTAAEMRIASGLLAMSVWKQLGLISAALLLFLPMLYAAVALHAPFLFFVALATLLTWIFGLSFAPTTVRVGTDGIVTRWLGRTRFIPHADIARTQTYVDTMGGKTQHGVRVRMKDGKEVRLPTGQTNIGQAEAARLDHRIDEAREASARGARGGTTDILARGDRTLADWVRYLRGVGAGAVGPRAPAVPSDVLVRIVEDNRAAPIERASAAVAAVATGDDDARRRIRIAADTTASPKLRIALERIATPPKPDEDDAALEEALEELNAEREAS